MNSHAELRAAIVEAGDDISDEGVDGIIALIRRILREDLLGHKQMQERFGINSSAMNMRAWRGSAPTEAGRVGGWKIWFRPDVEEYIDENPKSVRHHEPEEAA